MSNQQSTEARYDSALDLLKSLGQEHLLRWWGELSEVQREHLLEQIESIPWPGLGPLIESHVLGKPEVAIPHDLIPAPVYPQPPEPAQEETYAQAIARGEELIAGGKVAAFTVAGGQGTRLGVDGPKGAVEVTPVGDRTLFSIFAETVKAVRDRHGVAIPWYIMTSPANHQQTLDYLRSFDFFGLVESDVRLFPQAMLPAFDLSGKAILARKDSLALAPDGHGGSLKALVESDSLADMRARGVEIISYFQVDNPLVRPFDPLFVGLHDMTGSEMSSKVSPKVDDLERVGNVCLSDGKVTVVEYSDFPEQYARARSADGTRKFDAGNLAMHALSVSFVDRIVGKTFELPYRRAEKAVAQVGEDGVVSNPDKPNAVKLEAFVFDALPLAKNPLVLQVDRAEEFSPVKNAVGVDSLESARCDQNRRACRWIEAAGVAVPKKPGGEPDITVTICPSFAIDAEGVKRRRDELPKLTPGAEILLR